MSPVLSTVRNTIQNSRDRSARFARFAKLVLQRAGSGYLRLNGPKCACSRFMTPVAYSAVEISETTWLICGSTLYPMMSRLMSLPYPL